jgi:hypothetical protein
LGAEVQRQSRQVSRVAAALEERQAYLNGVGVGVSAPTLLIAFAIVVGVVLRLLGG